MWRHVQQPNNYTCGPACVAIITGAPLDELIPEMRVSPKNGCRNSAITKALRARGVVCGDRFASVRGRALPDAGVIRIFHTADMRGHVLVKHGRMWFDPLMSGPFAGDPPKDHAWPVVVECGGVHSIQSWRIASALWVAVAT